MRPAGYSISNNLVFVDEEGKTWLLKGREWIPNEEPWMDHHIPPRPTELRDPVKAVLDTLAGMPDALRRDALSEINTHYCPHCHDPQDPKRGRCQCWNDE